MRRQYLYATSFLAGLTVIGTLPAFAQQAAQGGLEEIVVTARKVEENLMVVPMSIAAVTSSDIAAAGWKDINQMSLYTPGLWAEYGSGTAAGGARQLTFRGLSVSTGQVFIDGAPFIGTGNPPIGDVDRVEVLVGPQSAYFGRATFEGALNYVTKDPGDTFKGQINGEWGKFSTTDDSVALEGPLAGDKLGARVIFRHYATAGEWPNYDDPGENLGGLSNNSLMANLVFKPTDTLKVKVLLGYENENQYSSAPDIELFARDPNPNVIQSLFCNLGGSFGPYWCGALPKINQIPASIISQNDILTPTIRNVLFSNALGFPTVFPTTWMEHAGARQDTYMGHLNIEYSAPSGWTFSSITAFHRTKSQSIANQQYRDDLGDPNPDYGLPTHPNVLPYIGFLLIVQNIYKDASEEVRVTSPQDQRLRGTVGGNFLYQHNPGQAVWGFEPAAVTFVGNQTRTSTTTPAVFAGLYYDIVDKLTLGAEGRYQWDTLKDWVIYPAPAPLLSGTFTSFSPRVTLDYKYAPNSDIYALWSRGYRPGGFNPILVNQTPQVLSELAVLGAQLQFSQEKLDNFEAGIKSTWLDGHLQTRIGAYFDEWRNGQISQTFAVNQTGGGVVQASATTNIGAVNLHGIEFEANAAVTQKLTVAVNFDWAASKIIDYYSAQTIEVNNNPYVDGHVFPHYPVVSGTFTPTYTDHLSGDWDWYGRLDLKYRGKYYADVSNVAWLAPAMYLDLHLGIKDNNKKIEIYGTNLTNNLSPRTASQANDPSCCVGATNVNGILEALPDKRSFGIKGSYTF